MKFELNKKYKLRGGAWGMPVHEFGGPGKLLVVTDCEVFYCVQSNGQLYSYETSTSDLLPELWIEPQQPKKLYAYTDTLDAVWFTTSERPLHSKDKRVPEYDLEFPVKEDEI